MTVRCQRRGFTLIELFVAITVMCLLISLLLPALSASRDAARNAQCVSNLRNIGQAVGERLVTRTNRAALEAASWQAGLAADLKSKEVLVCPSAQQRDGYAGLSCRVTHGGWPVQMIPLEAGPRCQKKNVTAASYELWFEDWNNWDYRDLRLLVEEQPGGASKLTVIQVDSSSAFDILTDNGTPLLSNITSHNWTGRSCTTRVGLIGYGINNRCAKMTGRDSRRILILDYHKPIADVVGADASDVFLSQVAARHRERLNVLYVDGSVGDFEAKEIDPADLKIHNQLWRPSIDPPLN